MMLFDLIELNWIELNNEVQLINAFKPVENLAESPLHRCLKLKISCVWTKGKKYQIAFIEIIEMCLAVQITYTCRSFQVLMKHA